MRPRFPWLATCLVALAVAAMIGLGVWQLCFRLPQKLEQIRRFDAAQGLPPVPLIDLRAAGGDYRFRRVAVACDGFSDPRAVGGRNAAGQSGWAHWATCHAPATTIIVVLGWSSSPAPVAASGARVTGIVVGGDHGRADHSPERIIADPPLAGLAANARPDPHSLPNNHFAYAMQWFLFAATALVIYALALRKRLAGGGPRL